MKDVLLMTLGAVIATVAGLIPDWREHRRNQRRPCADCQKFVGGKCLRHQLPDVPMRPKPKFPDPVIGEQ